MRKPADLAYGLDDRPPATVIAATALQQVAVVLIWVFPGLVLVRTLGASPAEAASLFSLTFIAAAAGTVLQAVRDPRFGCGFLAPVGPSSPHIVPSVLAVQAGGMPLLAGMTLLCGIATILMARALGRLRALLPPEVAGTVVFIIGLGVCLLGARMLVAGGGEAPGAAGLGVAALTLLLAVGLGIWGKGVLRWACVLVAMLAGTLAAALTGTFETRAAAEIAALPVFALPDPRLFDYDFDLALLPVFVIASLASSLKTAGLVTSLQKTNDAAWTRPDQRGLAGGVTGDGLATTLAGLLGAAAVNVSATNVALQMAAGVTSRVIAYATAGLCLVLASFPQVAAWLAQVPAPVVAGTLLYSGALMLSSGMQLASARLADARRGLCVGLAIAAALAVEAVPQFAAAVPDGLRPLLTATAFGTLVALLLNAVLRIGTRRSVTLAAPGGAILSAEVEEFATRAGGAWGARRDVVARLAQVAAAGMDAVAVAGVARGDATLTLSLIEGAIELRIAWQGPALPLAERAPTPEEMLDDPDAPARLSGHMLRRLSDRLRQRRRGEANELVLVLEH